MAIACDGLHNNSVWRFLALAASCRIDGEEYLLKVDAANGDKSKQVDSAFKFSNLLATSCHGTKSDATAFVRNSPVKHVTSSHAVANYFVSERDV